MGRIKQKILLIDIDSKILNLALKKIEKYHTDKGDNVIWNVPLFKDCVDKIYVSCIFDWNREKCNQWKGIAEIGGSGYDIFKTLPPEIEVINPKINWGFTTRGCIRKCKFCVVPKKEGAIKIVGDIYDIWDGKSKEIILADNNILAVKQHFLTIANQLIKHKLKVDFNQGLDHRLLTDEIAKTLKQIKHTFYRFSWDEMKSEQIVRQAIDLLNKNQVKKNSWYCLVGFNTTPRQDLYRLNVLKQLGQYAYVQRYHYTKSSAFYISLARWGNQYNVFKHYTWTQFMNHPSNKKYKLRIIDEVGEKILKENK